MNIIAIITILILIGTIIWIIKYLEKNLPKRDQRIITEHDTKIKKVEIKRRHEEKKELEIQKIVNSENRKKMYKDNMKKGREYEKFIAQHFENLGYKTKEHGLIHGRKDKGIDLIIMKNKEVTLIQCKNWKAESKYKIKHKDLKEFLGNTTAFLENNKEKAEGFTIKRLYITSNDVLDNSARHFLKENTIVEHKVILI